MSANELTRILNVVTPKVYESYQRERTAELSVFVQSGIAVTDERVSRNITAGGKLVEMPFWQDITSGAAQVLGDGDKAITTEKIEAERDTACVMYRGQGWQVNELAAVVSGDDPLGALMDRVAAWWVRQEQLVLLSVLKGIFAPGGALRDTHYLDASDRNISAKLILDTKQLLGDVAERVSVLAMHSAVFTELQKQNLIEYIPNARGEIGFPTYLGYRVVVDDGVPYNETTETYTTFLFGTGSIGRNGGNPTHLTTFETDRDKAKGNDVIYTRTAQTMHPYGVRWTDNDRESGNITPTNTDLENPNNWELVYEPRNVAILAVEHKVGDAGVIGAKKAKPVKAE